MGVCSALLSGFSVITERVAVTMYVSCTYVNFKSSLKGMFLAALAALLASSAIHILVHGGSSLAGSHPGEGVQLDDVSDHAFMPLLGGQLLNIPGNQQPQGIGDRGMRFIWTWWDPG